MKSKDLLNMQKEELLNRFSQALKDGDEGAVAQAFTDFAESIQNGVLEEAQELLSQVDSNVLSARGVRQLTTAEQKFYSETIKAMGANDVRQAISNIEVAMPETVMESVFEDIRVAHPLLNEIQFVNTMGKIKMIVNKTGVQLAAWGALTSEITKELSGSLGEIDTGLFKLTAFIPVSKAMLDLGPNWLDRYIREILSEAIAASVENAIVDGDGNGKPIGMTRDVSDDVTVTGGVYPQKAAVSVTKLDPVTYGNILSTIATDANGKPRAVSEVILVVNPVTYFKKIMPAIRYMNAEGKYVDALPHPTKIIQAVGVPDDKAIMGLSRRYFMGVGSPKEGKIEYDDSVQFLEDNRVYAIRLYGNGMPLDDNAFQLLDVSNLTPYLPTVDVNEVKGTVKTKEQA